jgi:hypothetical protein
MTSLRQAGIASGMQAGYVKNWKNIQLFILKTKKGNPMF